MTDTQEEIYAYLSDYTAALELAYSESDETAYLVAQKDTEALSSELGSLTTADGSFVSREAKALVTEALYNASQTCRELGHNGLAVKGQRLARDAKAMGLKRVA